MSTWDLFSLNLRSPAVLCFLIGLVASRLKSDLRFPESVTTLLSSYLLLAIGIKGGMKLRDVAVGDLVLPALVTVALGVVVAVVAFALARSWLGLDATDAAAVAAHYGSVSAVTFTAAETFVKAAGLLDEGYLPALVALMEVPGIIVALLLASSVSSKGAGRAEVLREILTGKSIVLLGGGILVGIVASGQGLEAVEPLYLGLFPGVLSLFLLDLGTLAGQRLGSIVDKGVRALSLAVALPLAAGVMGTLVGTLAGLSVGGAAVLGTMAASASYIAAPAAVGVGLPHANLGLALGLALGVTFPFNLAIGIPIYVEVAKLAG